MCEYEILGFLLGLILLDLTIKKYYFLKCHTRLGIVNVEQGQFSDLRQNFLDLSDFVIEKRKSHTLCNFF